MSGGGIITAVAVYVAVALALSYACGRRGTDDASLYIVFWPAFVLFALFIAVIGGPVWLGLCLYNLGRSQRDDA